MPNTTNPRPMYNHYLDDSAANPECYVCGAGPKKCCRFGVRMVIRDFNIFLVRDTKQAYLGSPATERFATNT